MGVAEQLRSGGKFKFKVQGKFLISFGKNASFRQFEDSALCQIHHFKVGAVTIT